LAAQDAALSTTRALAERVARLSPRPACHAARAEAGKLFYQCVYIRMQDDDALTAAHQLARDAYGSAGSAGALFMPHASVIYGDLGDAEKLARTEQARPPLRVATAAVRSTTLTACTLPPAGGCRARAAAGQRRGSVHARVAVALAHAGGPHRGVDGGG
jgi:hypothetical protein